MKSVRADGISWNPRNKLDLKSMRFHTQLVFQLAPDYFSVMDPQPLYFIRTCGEDYGSLRSSSLCALLGLSQPLTMQAICVYKYLLPPREPRIPSRHGPCPRGWRPNLFFLELK